MVGQITIFNQGYAPYFFLKEARRRRSKSSTNALFAVKCFIENNSGATSLIGGLVSPPSDQKNWNVPRKRSDIDPVAALIVVTDPVECRALHAIFGEIGVIFPATVD